MWYTRNKAKEQAKEAIWVDEMIEQLILSCMISNSGVAK